ncbi:MAG: hypothetical protein KatS3mg050_2989 [Litorilinea sp.]|nr:MAG: hypothetical protein KatS3mg050_2989 [Litorilinea sp.]
MKRLSLNPRYARLLVTLGALALYVLSAGAPLRLGWLVRPPAGDVGCVGPVRVERRCTAGLGWLSRRLA